MSTLKTNNIEHLDASSPSIQLDVGGGIVVAGVITATSMDLSGSDGFTVGTGASVSSPATNVLVLGTNNAERVRINSNGWVGIRTTAPLHTDSALDIEGSTPVLRISSTGDYGSLTFADAGDDHSVGGIVYDHTNDSLMLYGYNNTERLRITSGGDVNVSAGGSVFIANGNLVFSTSGTGIDFSATGDGSGTTTSELLDDYEEGTWTPGYEPNTGAFTSITYSDITEGRYTRIGNLVTCSFVLRTGAITVGTAAGNLFINGLPFASAASNAGSGTFAYSANFAGEEPNACLTQTSDTRVRLYYKTTADGNSGGSNVTDLGTGGSANYIIAIISYFAA